MTDFEAQIDQQVGLDTERERVTYLKFVNLGRSLEQEALKLGDAKIYSESELQAKIAAEHELGKSLHYDLMGEALDAVDAALKQAGNEADQVSKIDEHGAFEQLKAEHTAPEQAELLAKFEALLKAWDDKHAAIYKERVAATQAVRAKYLAPPKEAPHQQA